MRVNKETATAIFKAMGWQYTGMERDYHQFKRSDSEYEEPETFFFTDNCASAVASNLGLLIDFRRGFVESPQGSVAQFEIGSSDDWARAVYELAEKIGRALP